MANKFKGKEGTIYIREISTTLRNLFHASCARRGKSMKGVIVAFMKSFTLLDAEVEIPNTAKGKRRLKKKLVEDFKHDVRGITRKIRD